MRSRNWRTVTRKRSCSSANIMCAESSNTTSSAFGSRRAMSCEAPTAHVRSWRPPSTSTGCVTSPSRSSTSIPPTSARFAAVACAGLVRGEPVVRLSGNAVLKGWQCLGVDLGLCGGGHCADRQRGGVRDGRVACWPWFAGAGGAGAGRGGGDRGRAGHGRGGGGELCKLGGGASGEPRLWRWPHRVGGGLLVPGRGDGRLLQRHRATGPSRAVVAEDLQPEPGLG